MSLGDVAQAVGGVLTGDDREILGVSTDSRTIHSGELFVALHGPSFNGHRFVDDALSTGAAGVIVDEPVATILATVRVPDTKVALGRLALHWRSKFDIPVIGVTGSNGKTTVKEMLGAILGVDRVGLITEGNLNNEIGVPLTLLRLRDKHRFAVIEMGMNHAGEIDYLSRMARPAVAVITNAAPAHLDGLGNVEAVAKTKAEIFAGLGSAGIAVINGDDRFAPLWRAQAGTPYCIQFGLGDDADVTGEYTLGPRQTELSISTETGTVAVRLPLPGAHNVMNALAATAAVLPLGIGLEQVRAGLESMPPIPGRLQLRRGLHGATIYDDTYNANPESVRVAIDVLAKVRGQRLLVLGDMAELGEAEIKWHRNAGRYAEQRGIEQLFALGPLSEAAVDAFGRRARHFGDVESLVRALRDELNDRTTVLVKGSRCMGMEIVVAGVVAPDDETGGGLH